MSKKNVLLKKASEKKPKKSKAKNEKKIIALDYSTATELPAEDPRRLAEDSPVFAFLCENSDGDEVCVHLMRGNIPAEVKKALKL